ncbi:DUF6221 family protein [Streptomyces sp. B21-106]|uniref:DUF6221 family protein n=1 Tax=Streptomyces sp. B21-106 TaxID=3039418 RepID=UPI002FF0DCC6
MSGLVEFLRARLDEARAREHGKRRSIPSPFDGHDVEITYSSYEGQQVIVDGHPYPAEQYFKIATEPAPDPNVIADLDAKQRLLDLHAPDSFGSTSTYVTCKECSQGYEVHEWGPEYPCVTVRLLGLSFTNHPDYDERWRP